MRRHLDRRSQPDADLPAEPAVDLKAEFAALVNARPSEISYNTSTSVGENLIVNGLGVRRFGGNVVTDALHFDGALVHLHDTVPIDVRATGVDFCACSSFKWLMGDFGAGFLYVREELLERVVARTHIGYHSTTALESHFPPFDPQAGTPVIWTMRTDATGHFESGSTAHAGEAALRYSLPYIRQLGVANIQAHRQPLLARIRTGMLQLGFTPATPAGTTSPIITFATRDGRAVAQKLERARVNARVSDYWIRLSPSVFNDLADVDRLLEALS